MSKSYTCPGCGLMLSWADDPHNCPNAGWCVVHNSQRPCMFCQEVHSTGTTIAEEIAAKPKSIAQYKEDIIEIACELRRSDSSADSVMCDAVDAYHCALRAQAREGKT